MLTLLILLFAIHLPLEAKVYDFTEGNEISLLENPRTAAQLKLDLIKKAKHHIHIITFFWDETSFPSEMARELKAAHKRGVEIRILTTGFATFTTDLTGKGRKQLKTKKSDTVFSLTKLAPGRFFTLTHNFHEKIFIADAELAIIGGRNISNSSFRGKDLEVLMKGPVVNQVQDHFKVMFDFVTDVNKRTNCVSEDSEACEKELNLQKFNANSTFFPEQPLYASGVKARFLSHEALIHHYEKKMNKAERLLQKDDILETVMKMPFEKLRMYQYFMMPTKRFEDYLHQKLNEGKKIEVISNSIESGKFSSNAGYIYSLPEMLRFLEAGMDIYQWNHEQDLNYVHEKLFIFDENVIIIGSHNLVTGSTSVSNEVAVEIHSEALAQRLIQVFTDESQNLSITKPASKELFLKEIEENKRKIKIFKSPFVGGYLREIY